jgi:hypothetical protein
VPRRDLIIVGLFALALVPRLVLLALRPAALQFWEYESLAVSIASGQGYVINRFGHNVLAFGDGNLYSFLAGAIYATLGHQPLVLAAIQAVLASLAVPVLYVIAERPFGSSRAALGAALAALHPGLMAYTLKLHPLGLDVLLLALLVWWSVHRSLSGRNSVVAGLTLGLNLMTRPTYFVAGVVAWIIRWRQHRHDARYLLTAAAVGLAIAAPWVARNWTLLGQPMLISTGFEDIWKGNNISATGSGYVAPGMTVFDVAPARLQQRLWQADEVRVNALFAEETAEFVQQQPGQFVSLVARKFFYFWWLPAEVGLLYPVAWLNAYQIYAVVMYAFAAVGAIGIVRYGTSRERELLQTIASIGLTLAIVHALAYVEGRHRWGFEPLVLLVAARGMFSVAGWLLERGGSPQSRMLRRLKER